jgi:hypothetical protein
VRGFLQAVPSQLCSANHDNWAAAQKQIDTVMLDVAWDAMNFSPFRTCGSRRSLGLSGLP